ncbi:MAG: Trm112 family protein [Candidatus Marinimicrobia bacterium]|nr:Trm112 family protein [Candidatus Neomarinimicrobiota bacterium]
MIEKNQEFSIDADHLDIICCPRCHGDLEYIPEKKQLLCSVCSTNYQIKDGIPVLLSEQMEQ